MSVTEITSQTPFRLTLTSPAAVNGGGEVELDATAIVGAGVTPAAVAAAQSTADEALADASVVWVSALCPSIIGPFDVSIPFPVTGTLTTIRLSASAQTDINYAVTTSIRGAPVTGGTATLLSTDLAGTVKSASPSAGNDGVAGTTSVIVTFPDLQGNPGTATVLLGFTRA